MIVAMPEKNGLKAKITAPAAISRELLQQRIGSLSDRFYKCLNALGTQSLSNLTPFFKNRYPLQVRLELTTGSLLGPGAITTKGCRFSTMSTLRHFENPFLALRKTRKFWVHQLRDLNPAHWLSSRAIIPHIVTNIKPSC